MLRCYKWEHSLFIDCEILLDQAIHVTAVAAADIDKVDACWLVTKVADRALSAPDSSNCAQAQKATTVTRTSQQNPCPSAR
jgi:hypothetical protein